MWCITFMEVCIGISLDIIAPHLGISLQYRVTNVGSVVISLSITQRCKAGQEDSASFETFEYDITETIDMSENTSKTGN